jgi:hypothetical protein
LPFFVDIGCDRTYKSAPVLKAWAARANPQHTIAELRAALKESLKEESAGEGKRFRSGREAIRWLES